MKKFFARIAVTALTVALCAVALVGCGGYDVELPIGDSKIENDSIVAAFHIDDQLSEGYVLKGTFSAESEADLDREFVLSLCTDDPVFGRSYNEHVLFSFNGSEIDGKKLGFKAEFPKLSDFFEKTDTEKKFYIVLRAKADKLDLTNCNSSGYGYTFDGNKVKITK